MTGVDMIAVTFLIAIGSFIIVSLFMWIYGRNNQQNIFKKCGIPGPKFSFLTGNWLEINSSAPPNDVISKWLQEYGNIFGYYIGEMPFLVINDIELLKQILIKDFNNFINRPPFFVSIDALTDSVICLTNLRWKEVRHILTPTFSSNKIKLMFKIINDKISTTVNIISSKAAHNESFDIHQIAGTLALDVIADTSLAMKVNCQNNPNDPFYAAVKVFFSTVNNKAVDIAIMFPVFRNIFSFLSSYTVAGKMTNITVTNLKEVIEYRRQHPTVKGLDLLQLMLDVSDSNNVSKNEEQTNVKLTDREIIANAYVAILAGYETTANTLGFTFYLLAQHPEIQDRLHQEIVKHCLDNGEFNYDFINTLPYLDQVISESLRLYPPVIRFVTRECQNDYQLGQYLIAKGVMVQVPVWDIHHDPNLWPNPWQFNPERFSPENKHKIDKMSYLPFGTGPRNCIGMRLALLEIKLAVARLIKEFRFFPCDKTENPLTLICPTTMINPKNGIFIEAKRRIL